MSYNFLHIAIKKTNLYYLILVVMVIIILLTHYPRIYGKDAFQVMWMANALREGALFSENTWLISPFSYFGYYSFSHRAIAVPLFLAFLMSLLSFFSFGIFGITEAILALNIILIIIVYKCARNLGNQIFEEEWSRFTFVAVILFSMYVLNDITMTVSTRIIITILMIVFMNINLKVLNKSISSFKAMISMFLLLLIGSLAHRLWIGMLLPIVIMIFIIFFGKFKKLQKLTVFLILPLSFLSFFIGLAILNAVDVNFLSRLDPNQTFSPFFNENSLLGMGVLLSWFYVWNIGVISIFFPVGVIIMLYKLTLFLKNSDEKNSHLITDRKFFQMFYLTLFIIPFSILLPFTFYSIVIFFPLLIIFSIYGLIYVKKFISKYSESLSWILLAILLSVSILYSFLKVDVSANINLWYVFVLTFLSFILFFFVLMINKFSMRKMSKITINPRKMKKGIWILLLIFSIQIFSISTIETNRAGMYSSPYPWENISLSYEEIEIIEFFQNEEIDGLIFTTPSYISGRIAGVGFLPTFYGRSLIGKALWYDLVTSNEVIENTEFIFSFSDLVRQNFFEFWPKDAIDYYETSPIEVLRRNIIALNMTIESDRTLLRSGFNVQYIISEKTRINYVGNESILIQSLYQSGIEPIFTTINLLVWIIM